MKPMEAEPAREELVTSVLDEARRLAREQVPAFDAGVRLAEQCWHDIEALWDAQALVIHELDSAPTALANDMLPLLEAASDYYDDVQEGRRRQDTEPPGVIIVSPWPDSDES